jgi:hypothetical protein
MAAEATGPQFAGGRWRSAKILAALLAIVLGAQLLVLAKLELVGPALPEPVRLASPVSLDDPIAPSRAPRGYDLTIYVFSDYQCPSCRLLHLYLEHAITADGHIRLVYKDWVVFGDRSRRAARLAIAAQWQGRHGAMNDLLMLWQRPLRDPASAGAGCWPISPPIEPTSTPVLLEQRNKRDCSTSPGRPHSSSAICSLSVGSVQTR